MQQRGLFRHQIDTEPAHPSYGLARPSEARDESDLDGIIADEENDGNGRRRRLGRECRSVGVGRLGSAT
jgi:hypothetical protein